MNAPPEKLRPERPELPPAEPMFRVPTPVLAVVLLLVAVHFAVPTLFRVLTGVNWEDWSIYALAFIPVRLSTAVAIPQPAGAAYFSMLTYGLLHAGFMHLAANCLWLIVFGTPVARFLGGPRFFALAVLATIGGALATLAVHWSEMVILVGASGGVSGMLAAAIPIMYASGSSKFFQNSGPTSGFALLPFRELLTNYRALWFMSVWLAFTFFTGAAQLLLPTAFLGESLTAWETHLGGFLAGLIGIYCLAPGRVSANSNP
jgi:membrane associated rhomboid family serine protease